MPEFFELTFFVKKELSAKETDVGLLRSFFALDSGKNTIAQHPFSIFANREIWFDAVEESDYWECIISISDFIITRTNFDAILHDLLEIVDAAFERIESISFATGIYELTCYYLNNIRRLTDINDDIIKEFPFVFMKAPCRFNISDVKKYKNILYAVTTGEDVQNIFSDP